MSTWFSAIICTFSTFPGEYSSVTIPGPIPIPRTGEMRTKAKITKGTNRFIGLLLGLRNNVYRYFPSHACGAWRCWCRGLRSQFGKLILNISDFLEHEEGTSNNHQCQNNTQNHNLL